jgi:predicted TIM-barrel fold metal-dependent hydrolase
MPANTTELADLQGRLRRTHTKPVEDAVRRSPSPERPEHAFVSVDDHLCEPPDTFRGRLPSRFADQTPRVERVNGIDHWVFADDRVPLPAQDGLQSWEPVDWDLGLVSFDDFRPGVWNIHDRVRDMDLVGMHASLNFPSTSFGFAGQRFLRTKDRELGLAMMRAYHDWMVEDWAGPYPDRMILCQVAWLADPEVAADEIRHNAERGFRAVSFSENPEKLGLPSIHSGHWDPFLAACEETGTVVNLHVGSSSQTVVPSSDSPYAVVNSLFMVNGLMACTDWLYSHVPQRFPGIKLVLSEGGIGWVPMVLDRLRYQSDHFLVAAGNRDRVELDTDQLAEVLRRNFFFATFYDPSAMRHRHDIGTDRIMIEVDYPHGDSTWPNTQRVIAELVADLTPEERRSFLFANACRLYRHPEPPERVETAIGAGD